MHLIFDFDGTIVDSFLTIIEKFNILANEFNLNKINQDELLDLKDLSSRELVKYLKIPIHKIPMVLYQAREYLHSEMPKLNPVENIHEVLQELKNANYCLGILTSNSEENVIKWLNHNNMKHFFNFIHIESSYFGKGKLIKKILKKYQIDRTKAFYIGDETRDIEAAKKNGIYSVAVTWGFNSEKILLQHEPHYVVRKPEDILRICGLLDKKI